MKMTLTALLCFICAAVFAAGQLGYILDYDVSGFSIGQTKIQGNLKMLLKQQAKRVSSSLFYQEAGQPFPNLDEKEIIVDFKNDKKYHYSADSDEWLSAPLSEDFSILDEKKVKINLSKTPKEITAVMDMSLAPEFGGKQKYTIKLSYINATSSEVNEFKKIVKPSAVDFLSMFIDNEKLIDLLNKKIIDDRFRIPDKFQVNWQQNGKDKLKVNGSLQVKLNEIPPDKVFLPK